MFIPCLQGPIKAQGPRNVPSLTPPLAPALLYMYSRVNKDNDVVFAFIHENSGDITEEYYPFLELIL